MTAYRKFVCFAHLSLGLFSHLTKYDINNSHLQTNIRQIYRIEENIWSNPITYNLINNPKPRLIEKVTDKGQYNFFMR